MKKLVLPAAETVICVPSDALPLTYVIYVRTQHHLTHLYLPSLIQQVNNYWSPTTSQQLSVSNCMITHFLRKAADCTAFPGNYIIGSLQNSRAQPLLKPGVQKAMIQLIGRWSSNEIFRYLTANYKSLMQLYYPTHHAQSKCPWYLVLKETPKGGLAEQSENWKGRQYLTSRLQTHLLTTSTY
jgi:hypothetical protein